jgi:hypothetical protein
VNTSKISAIVHALSSVLRSGESWFTTPRSAAPGLPRLFAVGSLWLALAYVLFLPSFARGQSQDFFGGNLMLFDDNGIWTWYSDERAVVDNAGGKLVVGCVENAAGLGGIPRDGNINVSIFDKQTLAGPRWTLRTNLTSFGGGDDHNAPGLLVMANGHYVALYTGHNQDSNTWYRVYDPATMTWSPEALYDWSTQPGGTDFRTTYSNPWNMTAEKRTYNFARSNGGGSPTVSSRPILGPIGFMAVNSPPITSRVTSRAISNTGATEWTASTSFAPRPTPATTTRACTTVMSATACLLIPSASSWTPISSTRWRFPSLRISHPSSPPAP